MTQIDHTTKQYAGLQEAYNYFNSELFESKLPNCLITLQKKKNSNGFFHAKHFINGEIIADEIAMNPAQFTRSKSETLSTLAHEMTHLWQHHFGKESKSHHNRQWADKMFEIGLMPSSTAQPGGKQTGQKVSHYILPNMAFDIACQSFLQAHELTLYIDNATEESKAKAKAKNKVTYICPDCELKAWGKPSIKIACVECSQVMRCEDAANEEDEQELDAA